MPKLLVGPDGSLGAANGVACGSIERKMGIHGNATCVMNYDGARGWLVGEANRGLQAMFVMMNEARLGVAIQGLAQSEAAYQNAAAYAKERLQGRSLTGPQGPRQAGRPDHRPPGRAPDAPRRSAPSTRRPGRLVIWTALQSDIAHRSEDEAERSSADDRLGLLTPVLKGVLTDLGFDNAVRAQQVFGGHGYVEEWGMSQFVRDARIAMIYEGANGIQALDLVGRKLPRNGGRAAMAFFGEVDAFCRDHAGDEGLSGFVAPLQAGARAPAGGDDVVHGERRREARQRGRGRDRLHAPLRARGDGLYVGADGEGGAGEEGGRATAWRRGWTPSSSPAASSWSGCCRRRACAWRGSRREPIR